MNTVLQTAAWGSFRAGSTLTLGSTSWLLSGLTASPLVNGLLPALGALPALLPLPLRATAGYTLQLASALLLLLVSLRLTGASVGWPLVAILLFSLGGQMSRLPLQHSLRFRTGVPAEQLRRGESLGAVLGNLLTGLLFPVGKAVAQYGHAVLLMLPLLPLAWRSRRGATAPDVLPHPAAPIPLRGRAILQGVLFGSLFGLLALWVRKVGAGNCFDFGMVLTTYGIGRFVGTTSLSPRLIPGLPYLLIAGLLAATQQVPGWAAVLLFLPMGVAAVGSDSHLVEALSPQAEGVLGWQALERSTTLGGLIGSVVIGGTSQALGLEQALPIEVAAFLLAALLLRRS